MRDIFSPGSLTYLLENSSSLLLIRLLYIISGDLAQIIVTLQEDPYPIILVKKVFNNSSYGYVIACLFSLPSFILANPYRESLFEELSIFYFFSNLY